MAFPFYWIGAVSAGVILGTALTLFVLVMRAFDRAATEVRGSILPGLVDGLRDWADERRPDVARRIGSPFRPDRTPPDNPIEELTASAAPAAERLHPHLR